MTMHFSQPQAPDGPVLQMVNVTFPPHPSYDVGMEDVTLSLSRGELALILLEHGISDHPLADVVSGLVPVEQGRVALFGKEWSGWSADEQAQARWRMGRVFEGHGWLSNLDVDENVTLSERHHSSRTLDDITAEAEQLARMVHLEALPATRPSVTEREALRRAEWVRAALGSPWLLLLERPGRDLADGWLDDLIPLVDHVRARGAAVVWLAESGEEWKCDSLKPSLKFEAKGNTLRPISDS